MVQGANEDDALLLLTDEQLEALGRRLDAARSMASRLNRTRIDVQDAAQTAGVSAATLYRDLGRMQGRGTIRELIPRPRGYPKGRSRLDARQEQLIDEFLKVRFLKLGKFPLTGTVQQIGEACELEGLRPPSRATIIRRLNRFPARTVTLKREGAKAAEKSTPRPGRFEVPQPWAVWQADHTLTDVIVVDENGKPIGRAWLTVIIDVCTRLVVSFYVGLDPPSTIRIATAMDLAVSQKTAWLDERGLDYLWPAEGLPKMVHTDRAKEFTSPVFERALKNQGVNRYLRPPGRTRFGGHVERLIGTLMGPCRMLPGATYNSTAARGSYDSKSAAITVDRLEIFFAHQILGKYHNTVHRGIGMSPLDAWEIKSTGLTPEHPYDMRAFRLDLFPEEERTIGRQGIQFHGEDYYSSALGELYIKGTRHVILKYDPRNMSRIYVKAPHGDYIEVPYRFARAGAAPTLWLLKAARRSRLPGERVGDAITARLATRRTEELLERTAPKSTGSARQSERLRRDREAGLQALESLSSARSRPKPPADDDWGDVFGMLDDRAEHGRRSLRPFESEGPPLSSSLKGRPQGLHPERLVGRLPGSRRRYRSSV